MSAQKTFTPVAANEMTIRKIVKIGQQKTVTDYRHRSDYQEVVCHGHFSFGTAAENPYLCFRHTMRR